MTQEYMGWDPGGPDRTVIYEPEARLVLSDESFFGDAELLERFGERETGVGAALRLILTEQRLPLDGYAFLRVDDLAGWRLVKREVAMRQVPGATIVMVR